MKFLAIDTSCDETSVAVTEDARVLSNVISSQIRYHKKFGGVVPMLAARLHTERIDYVISEALQRAKMTWRNIDAIAVTYGPGLAPALGVGIAKAQELAIHHKKPLYGVNHMAGHIASALAVRSNGTFKDIQYPALALLVSGGHTEMVYFERFGEFTILGQTLDDAIGEAYDKVAKMTGLGYPGGKVLSKLAESGNSHAFDLPIPMRQSGDLNFSYSGLKNAVRLVIEDLSDLTSENLADLAASFQRVALAHITNKLEKALDAHPEVMTIIVAGGVAANGELRKQVRHLVKNRNVVVAIPYSQKLCTDNAAMIGVAAWLGAKAGQKPVQPEELDRSPGLKL